MSDEKSEFGTFKVVDRRRFTDEGETKTVELESSSKVSEPKQTQPSKDQKETESSNFSTEYSPIDFSSFIVSLATQVMSLLGEIPNQITGEVAINVDAARQTIDIIGLLEEKTRGNLNQQESALISDVLTSLRVAYVRRIGEVKKKV